jgi:hypothetical protein
VGITFTPSTSGRLLSSQSSSRVRFESRWGFCIREGAAQAAPRHNPCLVSAGCFEQVCHQIAQAASFVICAVLQALT